MKVGNSFWMGTSLPSSSPLFSRCPPPSYLVRFYFTPSGNNIIDISVIPSGFQCHTFRILVSYLQDFSVIPSGFQCHTYRISVSHQQDIPFICLRLTLIFGYGVISPMDIFFTCKNSLVRRFYRIMTKCSCWLNYLI